MELSPLVIGLIVAGVILVIIVIALVVRASGKNKAQRLDADRERAAELRHDVDRDQVALQEEQLHVHETELAAERARVEAERARIDAEDMERQAAHQRSGLGEAQTDIDDRRREADEIDPDVRADGRPASDHRDAHADAPSRPQDSRDPDDGGHRPPPTR